MKKFIAAIIVIASISLVGCGPSNVVVRERPVVPVYVRPVQPNPSYIWVEGGYVRSGRGYVYRQGYWVAQRRGRVYHQGYWKQTRRGYVWVNGRW
ncbi:MAG: hypothetical protein ABIP30_14205 [Ferruginibacter sp.]